MTLFSKMIFPQVFSRKISSFSMRLLRLIEKEKPRFKATSTECYQRLCYCNVRITVRQINQGSTFV